MEKVKKPDVYEIITDRVISLLENSVIPWHRPWKTTMVNQKVEVVLPQNAVSNLPYHGINAMLLHALDFDLPYFLTFRQAKEHGGMVKKGEKGFPVLYYEQYTKEVLQEDGSTQDETVFVSKYYIVFNVEQCEGLTLVLPELVEPNTEDLEEMKVHANEDCESLIKGIPSPPSIHIKKSDKAFYQPDVDTIVMPQLSQFEQAEEYYCTFFHELVHSTGHESRLAREGITEYAYYGSESYSKEELIAEMGASFLCAKTGIEHHTLDNSVAYIKSWIAKFKEDKKLLVRAASQARKAVEYLLPPVQN